MIDYVSIGKQIHKYRIRAGITQEQLAEIIDVSDPHISRIETGKTKPSLQTLVDLCNALDITIDDLMQDSLSAVRQKIEGRLGDLLADCSPKELDMLADIAETILKTTRKH